MTAALEQRPASPLEPDDRRPPPGIDIAVVVVALIVVATHTLALGRFPVITADEGGWPLAVRVWLTTHHATFDYYQAPAYLWALGLPFRIWGSSVAVARATSAVVSLIGLAFFAGVAQRVFRDRRAVLWAVLLLGVDYAALSVDRRALMEPFELAWMNALVFFYLGRGRRLDLVGIAVATAGIILTKASGAFILIALVLADLTDGRDPKTWRPTWTVMAVGVAGALAAFTAMHFTNPTEFAKGWSATFGGGTVQSGPAPHPSALLRLGFIVLDPQLGLTIIRGLALGSPFAFTLGTAGGLASLMDRRASIIGWWIAGGVGCNLIEAVWLENHIAVVYPALALGTVVILLALDRQAELHRLFGVRYTWVSVLFAGMVVFNLTEVVGGVLTTVEPSRGAMRWLDQHAHRTDVVLAAPYVTMQWSDSSHAFWELPVNSYVPSLDTLDRWHVRWLVVDRKEWEAALKHAATLPAMDTVLGRCCRRVYPESDVPTPPMVIYERLAAP
jgi:Dolichyl-phosphate-mannose-protein mannosyltransferase